MGRFSFDTETDLIAPGNQAPDMVCTSYVVDGGHTRLARWDTASPIIRGALERPDYLMVGANTAFDVMVAVRRDPDTLTNWFDAYEQNRVTDILTRQKLIDLAHGEYRGRPREDGTWETFRYNLADVARRYTGRRLDKENPWRLRFGELRHVDLNLWPAEASGYACDDATDTDFTFVAQERILLNEGNIIPDQFHQVRSALWLKLMSAWGIRTDPQRVEIFATEVEAEFKRVAEFLREPRGWGQPRNYPLDLFLPMVRLEVTRKRDKALAYYRKHYGEPKNLGSAACLQTRDPALAGYAHCGELAELGSAGQPYIDAALNAGLIVADYVRNTKYAARRMVAWCNLTGRPIKRNDPTEKAQEKAAAAGQDVDALEGNIKLDEETCKSVDDPILAAFGDLGSLAKTTSTDIPILRTGAVQPIHSHFEEILATGRTSSSGPNIQNVRRLEGIRECFVPREGNVFIDSDYGKLELHTLAQLCIWWLGWSSLATTLNAGRDPHTDVAAQIEGVTYEQMEAGLRGEYGPEIEKKWKNTRNCSKVANFGFPGGLGAETMVSYAATSYGVHMTLERAQLLKEQWQAAVPEMPEYFRYINSCRTWDGEYRIVMPWSGRIRSGATFCAACNSPFQGLGADVAKLAGWYLMRAQYDHRLNSPLFGARSVDMIHDQFLIEILEAMGHEGALETRRLMNKAGAEILPDVPCKADPILARRWSKNAKELRDAENRLIPWDEEKKAA